MSISDTVEHRYIEKYEIMKYFKYLSYMINEKYIKFIITNFKNNFSN
jgi:hypothetical protein